MTILVVGATGQTGRSLVEQLLENNHKVRIIVRSSEKLSDDLLNNPNLTIIKAAILDLSDEELAMKVRGCIAVVSCLGHVMNFNGIFGHPRKLCTDATRRLCAAIEKNNPATPVKFVLMSSVGVRNPESDRKRNAFDRMVLAILRHTLPPHRDNEMAAEYLHQDVGKANNLIEWSSVRPDSLINAEVSPYEIIASPVTGIFSGRPTTRANVANFMVALIENDGLWNQWKFKMPVIMNKNK